MAQSKNGGSSSNGSKEKEPDLNGALEDLKKLAEKPKKIAPEEVVRLGFELIETAIKQGYSYTDIRKVFSNRGVQISVKDLKNQYEAIAKTRG